MLLETTLRIDITSYWHAGTGLSAGSAADVLAERNNEGLPLLGGRHLKGLLRHACECAETWGWFADLALPDGPATTFTGLLFGAPGSQHTETGSNPGMVTVGDAALPPEEVAWLIQPHNSELKQALWQCLASTAIDEEGTALDHSLRTMEVTVPVRLLSHLSLSCTALDSARWQQQRRWLESSQPWQPIEQALSLIDGIGAKRSRGLGEAVLSLNSSPVREGAA